MELHFTVWQFVRLMVQLEDHPDSLFEAWDDVWRTLDTNLTELAEHDADAFSDMMMNQDVIIEDATPPQALAAEEALKMVMVQLDKAIAAAGANDNSDEQSEHLQSLKFERRELRQLTRKLARQGLVS